MTVGMQVSSIKIPSVQDPGTPVWTSELTSSLDFNVISVDKAPRLSISIVIWILSSDTICQLNQFNTNSEAAMLSRSVFLN